MVQTFWSKYKVLISGAVTATFTALAPMLLTPSHEWNSKALIVAGCLAMGAFLSQEARGKNWTILGQVAAGVIAFSSAYEGDFDVPRMVMAIAIAAFAIPLPPVKLSSYEHSEPIVEAKREAEAMNEEGKKINSLRES